nr:site-specific integrase [Mycolicibacterium aubagnense]
MPAVNGAGRVPELGGPAQERILRAAANAQSAGTRRTYGSSWARFEQWCGANGYTALPAHPAVIAAYLVEAADTLNPDGQHAYAVSTLNKWVAAITDRHRSSGLDSIPTHHESVRATLAGIRREYAVAGDRPRNPRAPLLTDDVMVIVAAARAQVDSWSDEVHERRDSALLFMGFTGAFRRSELVALTGSDVELHPLDGVHVRLRRSKTDQEGHGVVHALPHTQDAERCPPCAFARWARVVEAYDKGGRAAVIAAVTRHAVDRSVHVCRAKAPVIGRHRPIFRAIAGNGNLSDTAMSGASVHAVTRRRAERAGYSEAMVARIGAHSLRAGFVTQAFRNGADAHAIMRQTDHRSVEMVERYAREEAPLIGNAVTSLGL